MKRNDIRAVLWRAVRGTLALALAVGTLSGCGIASEPTTLWDQLGQYLANDFASGTECVHKWSEATCDEPRMCMECGAVEDEPRGHTWKGTVCERCGQARGELHTDRLSQGCGPTCPMVTGDNTQLVQFYADKVTGRWSDTGEPVEFLIITCVNHTCYDVSVDSYEVSSAPVNRNFSWVPVEVKAYNHVAEYTATNISTFKEVNPQRTADLLKPYQVKGEFLQCFCIGYEVPWNVIVYEEITVSGEKYKVELQPGKMPVWTQVEDPKRPQQAVDVGDLEH